MAPLRSDGPVLIVGAGPVGLALALGLARHGSRSTVVEKEPSLSEHSKAPGLHARTLEVFGQWGIADDVLRRALFLPTVTAHAGRTGEAVAAMPIEELGEECRFAGLCILEQAATERLLLEAALGTGLCEVRFGHELAGFERTRDGVTATIRCDGTEYSQEAPFLVGCDGAGSTVRAALGLPFDGITYPAEAVLADVRLGDARDELPSPCMAADGDRLMVAIRLDSDKWRVIRLAPSGPGGVDPEKPVEPHLIAQAVASTLGEGAFACAWSSRFRLHRRCAPRFRMGRVLLAGDAAHVNSPIGGQGMNAGIQDAHNLAWKLAAILQGADEERLLESYHAERHGLVTRTVNRLTDWFTRAALAPAPLRSLGLLVAMPLLRLGPVRKPLMRRLAMLAGRYRHSPLFEGADGAAGQRIPDVTLHGPSGRQRLHQLLGTRPTVLSLGRPPIEAGAAPGTQTVHVGEGGWRDPSGLLARRFGRGRVLLVRPDHFVGWAGEPSSREVLERAVRGALGWA